MVKNYFLKVFAGIVPSGLLPSLQTVPEHRNPHQAMMRGLRI